MLFNFQKTSNLKFLIANLWKTFAVVFDPESETYNQVTKVLRINMTHISKYHTLQLFVKESLNYLFLEQ